MRIAHVNSELGFSGGEQQLLMLMRQLRASGHENVLCCRRGAACGERARSENFSVEEVSMRNLLDARGVFQLRRAIARTGASIVTLHTGRANWLGGWASRLARVPAVTVRRMDRRVRRGLRTRLIYRTLTQATVAISPAVVDCLVAAGIAPDSIHLITDAVDPAELVPGRSAAEVRAAEGIAPERLTLLALASLDRRKGLDVLLDALQQLRDEHPALDPLLLVAGAGPERQALEQQIETLGLQAAVRLLGRREDAVDLLEACDLFVLPSRREGMGVAALEAMMRGRAVVASAVGGLRTAVEDGVTGRLVPPEDPAALAGALAALLEAPDLRARMAVAGSSRIRDHFLAQDQARRYLQLYSRLLGKEASTSAPAPPDNERTKP